MKSVETVNEIDSSFELKNSIFLEISHKTVKAKDRERDTRAYGQIERKTITKRRNNVIKINTKSTTQKLIIK